MYQRERDIYSALVERGHLCNTFPYSALLESPVECKPGIEFTSLVDHLRMNEGYQYAASLYFQCTPKGRRTATNRDILETDDT